MFKIISQQKFEEYKRLKQADFNGFPEIIKKETIDKRVRELEINENYFWSIILKFVPDKFITGNIKEIHKTIEKHEEKEQMKKEIIQELKSSKKGGKK